MSIKKQVILIVEDEAITAMAYQKKFEKNDFQVCGIASTGKKAIEIIKKKKPDIILFDIHLAGEIDGLDAARIINKKYDIPFIFMTGYSNENLRKQAMELTPLGFFVKPFDMESIISLIREHLV